MAQSGLAVNERRAWAALSAHAGRFVLVALSNVADVPFGRDVSYNVERIVLDEATEQISATPMRQLVAHPGTGKR
jgi:hypothetical protein